jgi:hypothetical protein
MIVLARASSNLPDLTQNGTKNDCAGEGQQQLSN